MTAEEKYRVVAIAAYNVVWLQSKLPEPSRRTAAFMHAWDAAKESGASAQAATQAADFARDEAR